MTRTKIEYAYYTWNPITGCLNTCEYCYARKIVNRFAKTKKKKPSEFMTLGFMNEVWGNGYVKYPWGFNPTLHFDRLDEPQKIKKPSVIFVCSMADMFGGWIPYSWIQKVFEACKKAPQHIYIFLTKNPMRYERMMDEKLLRDNKNFYFGSTVDKDDTPAMWHLNKYNFFINFEPLLEDVSHTESPFFALQRWIIIGSETNNRKNKIIPKREWIEKIVDKAKLFNIPIFMKNNLKSVWGDDLIQEYPWR